ncbi:MAG: outer membrane beta-barrel protein [Candidatus Sulfotelmatobacter sp.]
MQSRIVAVVFLWTMFAALPAWAQFYAGFMGGVATLSGDAQSIIDPNSTQFASYNATNGLVLNGFAGKHLNDFFSVQGEYVWNRNPLMLSAATLSAGPVDEYKQARSSSQYSLFASVLVYFRRRESRVRPYLSVGTGWVHLVSTTKSVSVMQGALAIPPSQFSADMIGLRVPVGIDVTLHRGWRFRYSFSETLSRNPISHELMPAGPHSLKNFQNLFGIVREF